MLQVHDGEPVRPSSSGIFADPDNGGRVVGGKGSEVVVKRVIPFDLSEGPAEVRVAGVDGDVGEEFGEIFGYCWMFGAGFGSAISGGKGDGLIGGNFRPLSGETTNGAPEFLDMCSMGDGGDKCPPSRTGGGIRQPVKFGI